MENLFYNAVKSGEKVADGTKNDQVHKISKCLQRTVIHERINFTDYDEGRTFVPCLDIWSSYENYSSVELN